MFFFNNQTIVAIGVAVVSVASTIIFFIIKMEDEKDEQESILKS